MCLKIVVHSAYATLDCNMACTMLSIGQQDLHAWLVQHTSSWGACGHQPCGEGPQQGSCLQLQQGLLASPPVWQHPCADDDRYPLSKVCRKMHQKRVAMLARACVDDESDLQNTVCRKGS